MKKTRLSRLNVERGKLIDTKIPWMKLVGGSFSVLAFLKSGSRYHGIDDVGEISVELPKEAGQRTAPMSIFKQQGAAKPCRLQRSKVATTES